MEPLVWSGVPLLKVENRKKGKPGAEQCMARRTGTRGSLYNITIQPSKTSNQSEYETSICSHPSKASNWAVQPTERCRRPTEGPRNTSGARAHSITRARLNRALCTCNEGSLSRSFTTICALSLLKVWDFCPTSPQQLQRVLVATLVSMRTIPRSPSILSLIQPSPPAIHSIVLTVMDLLPAQRCLSVSHLVTSSS
jgi:hypothetical protein